MTDVRIRAADAEEQKQLHRLGEAPVIASLMVAGGEALTVACLNEQGPALLGPFAAITEKV